MRGINKTIILGTLGKDPEIKYSAAGTAIVNISAATSEKWTDKNSGEPQEKTEWHRIVMFGKLAEIANQYLRKGSQAYFEGSLQTRSWDKDGVTRYTTEIKAHTMEMLGSKSGQAAGNSSEPAPAQPVPADNAGFDDIPF